VFVHGDLLEILAHSSRVAKATGAVEAAPRAAEQLEDDERARVTQVGWIGLDWIPPQRTQTTLRRELSGVTFLGVYASTQESPNEAA
jgi:hypothetical protein